MLSLLLVVYIAVALCNLSVVQSYLGTAAGRYFSREWGGTVRIASLHVSPLGHVKLRNILLVSPTQDTIFEGEVLYCHFNHFPLVEDGLELSRVRISNATYHMQLDSSGINLKYIFNYYARPERPKKTHKPFVVHVKRLILRHVTYKQDLRYQRPYYGHNDQCVNISHMVLRDIEGNIKDIRVEKANVDCRIVHLETTERSGFHLQDLSADVKVAPYTISLHDMELTTDNTHMRADIALDFDRFRSFSRTRVFDSVHYAVLLNEGTVVGLRDVSYWAPGLYGIDDAIEISGAVEGPLSNLHVENLRAAFGDRSQVTVTGQIKGLPQVAHTVFDLDIHNTQVSPSDLAALHQPQKPFFRIPSQLLRMGDLHIEGHTRGSLESGQLGLILHSQAGELTAEAAVGYPDKPANLRYEVRLHSDRLDVARLTGDDHLTASGLQLEVSGSGTRPDALVLDADATLRDAVVRQHRLSPITASLHLNKRQYVLEGGVNDTLADLQIATHGVLDGRNTSCDGRIKLRHAHLTELLGRPDSSGQIVLTTTADIALKGTDLNRMQGRLKLRDNHLKWDGLESDLDDLALTLEEENRYKRLHLESAMAQANLAGYLDYRLLPRLGQQFVQRFLPIDTRPSETHSLDSVTMAATAFDLDVRWDDPHRRLAILAPKMHIAPGTQLHLNYNYTESAKLVVRSDSLRLGKMLLHDIAVTGHPVGESYGASCRVDRIDMGGMPLFVDFSLFASSNPTTGRLRLSWDDDENNIHDQGNIGLFVTHEEEGNYRVQLTDHTFFLRGQRWDIVCDDLTLKHKSLSMPRLDLRSKTGAITANAQITPDGNASATANFEHFSIDLIDSLLLADKHLMLEGVVDGEIRAQRSAGATSPYLLAELTIDECSANDQPLGNVSIHSSLDLDRQQIDINATSTLHREAGIKQPFVAHGHITLADKPTVDMRLHLDQFSLATAAPLLSNFAARVDGTISTDMQISGLLSKPRIEGVAHIHDGLLQVDYTGVTYHCDDSVSLTNGRVTVKNFHIYDPQRNILVANGGIDYSDAKNLRIDLTVHSNRIEVLNTKSRGSNPYGTLMASIDGTITGRGGSISIDATAQTAPGSEITIPVDNRLKSTEQEYIHFTTPHRTAEETVAIQPVSTTTPAINLALTLTPDLKMNVPIDFNQLEVTISATGAGGLQLHTGAGRKLSLVGNYEFSAGTLDLSMLSLLEKRFTIEPGSSLLFPGDISSIRFDISAVYALRASLASLNGVQSENSQRNIPVQSIINLAGDLKEPSITFDLRLPNVDATTSEEVFAYIDRSNQRDMLNQTVSLLMIGQFYNSSNNNQALANTAATNGYNMMAQSASMLVSQIITGVDIDFGYTAATELTSEQFDIDISKSWDRFYFESTLGYSGESRNLSNNTDASAMNNLVGDILVGYKLNPRLHLFVFNRTNTNDYTRAELPYKQGVGLKYTRDFNRWGDLFHKSRQPQQ